ncbi:AHH domain-containing protein [Xenorhabdus bovienii]
MQPSIILTVSVPPISNHVIPKQYADHPALKKIKYDIDNAANGIFLREV